LVGQHGFWPVKKSAAAILQRPGLTWIKQKPDIVRIVLLSYMNSNTTYSDVAQLLASVLQ